jgi:hypothetical protein
MKAAETLIAWNDAEPNQPDGCGPPGSIGIGPLLIPGEDDWTRRYGNTSGAAEYKRRDQSGVVLERELMSDWYMLVYSYGLHPYLVHRAFLLIDEFQAIIKHRDLGPASDEPGHDPNGGGCGRTVHWPLPKLLITETGRATHFALAADDRPSLNPQYTLHAMRERGGPGLRL